MSEYFEGIAAKVEIQETLARYARGIDRHDIELAKSAYHEDGYDEHGPIKGNAFEVMDKVGETLVKVFASQHLLSNVLIELNGDQANVESCFFSLHIPEGNKQIEYTWGRYLDVFERRNGDWKIAHRRVLVDFAEVHDRNIWYGEEYFVRGTRNKQDPSYALFEG